MHFTAFAGGARSAAPGSISEQIAAIEAGLAAEAGSVIELVGAAIAPAAACRPAAPRRRAAGMRRGPRTMPRLLAWPSESGLQLQAWCPWCGWHYHGRHGSCEPGTCVCPYHPDYHHPSVRRAACTCPPGSGDGHRVAHCTSPDSPFQATGYWLEEIRP